MMGKRIRQLTVISGKGGTGKTTMVAAFATLAKEAVLADCDVDAPDLHLILRPQIEERMPFSGIEVARIDAEKCTMCGRCREHCRSGAIDENMRVIDDRCEGCGVCRLVCPVGAVELLERKAGIAYISRTRFGPMAHAELEPGGEASGKLVTLVRENARMLAEKHDRTLIIIDGASGIGCPVIAAIGGTDLVLIVTEPTLSGIHDMERVIGVCKHFGIPSVVCINKCDVNEENTALIESWCSGRSIEVIGKIPYDNIVTEAMIHEKTIVEYSQGKISRETRKIWRDTVRRLASPAYLA
jgi:MinD superfamily P-loop ATPase